MPLPNEVWICDECRTTHYAKIDTCVNCGMAKLVRFVPAAKTSPLRTIRKSHNLSQKALAELTGLKQPNLSRIEHGLTRPRFTTVAKLAVALNISVGELASQLSREGTAK